MKAITTDGQRRARARQWLQRHQRPVRLWLLASLGAALLNVLSIILQLGLMAGLIHHVLIERIEVSTLTVPALALLCAIVLRALSQAVYEYCGQRASAAIRQQVRADLLANWALAGPIHLAGRSSAILANQWLEQVQALDGYYARFVAQQWLAVLGPLLIGAVVLWQDWVAAGFLFLAGPLIPLFMALVGMSAERLNQQHVLEAGRLAGHFLDRVRSLTTLQLFGQVPATVEGVRAAADRYRQINMRTLRVAFLSSAVLEFFASAAIAVVAMYIGFGLLGYIDFGPADELTLFSGLFILLLAPEFFQPLRTLAQHYHDRAAALGAADAFASFEAQLPNRPAPVGSTSVMPASAETVRVDGLDLSYPGRGRILQGVELHVQRGEVVALVGPSGSGKSSLLHCLAGFLMPDTGSVAVFGSPAGTRPVAWLDQRPLLIQGSWADNLRFCAPQAQPQAMRAALEAAGLGDLLQAQAEGLDAPLGEGGRGLSGGQARRLALARAWLIDSDLVLLDEPTAGLDESSQQPVIEAIVRLAASGRTVIVATHHPAMMRLADRCLRLEQGRLLHA